MKEEKKEEGKEEEKKPEEEKKDEIKIRRMRRIRGKDGGGG